MGTNYYSIVTDDELKSRRKKLIDDINNLDISNPSLCEDGFRVDVNSDDWDRYSPWDNFIKETSIHLGKRSSGWKFCWNFHNNKYYTNKEELLEFIRSRRVVNEYDEELKPNDFIEMALNWDGIVLDVEYLKKHSSWMSNPLEYVDKDIDGLRVSSSTEFS